MLLCKFTAVLKPAEKGVFIVECLELHVATHGETREEAIKTLRKQTT
jgi:predicted RNase H-like HicB family nuclease